MSAPQGARIAAIRHLAAVPFVDKVKLPTRVVVECKKTIGPSRILGAVDRNGKGKGLCVSLAGRKVGDEVVMVDEREALLLARCVERDDEVADADGVVYVQASDAAVLQVPIDVLKRHAVNAGKVASSILGQHEAILNAVLKGDDLAAEAAMRQHLRNARNTYAKHPKIREA